MATVQLPDPWHAPDHPTKILPVAAVAWSVTDAPLLKLALQVPGQLMPLGLLVMVPDPPPAELTCRAYWLLTAVLNCAVTVRLDDKVTVQLKPLPEQAPDHPANCDPAAALAVSVTEVPCTKDCVEDVQMALQLRPAGVLLTVPWPVPDLDSVSNLCVMLKVAPTSRDDFMSKEQTVPVQAPDQPMNVESLAGVAASVTVVVSVKVALQVLPQLMPLGVLVTVPVPVPLTSFVTVMVLLTVMVSAGK
jgi:hypothetical protein